LGGRIYTSEVEHVFFAAFIPRTRGNLVPFNGKPFIPIPYIWRTVKMQYRKCVGEKVRENTSNII